MSEEEQLLKACVLKGGKLTMFRHTTDVFQTRRWYSSTCVCKMVHSHFKEVKPLIATYHTVFPQEKRLI